MSDFLAWVSHGVKRGRFELDAHATAALSVFIALLTLVAILYLGLVSRTAAQGRHIECLQAESLRLQRENQQTTTRIAEACALPRVRSRAEALGFVPAEQVEFLTGSE